MGYLFFQNVAIITAVVSFALFVYIKLLKNRIKKNLLRNDKIEKYFK